MADPTDMNKSAWSYPFGIALLVYYFVMAVVGLCIPDDILKVHAWAKEFSDFMASIVPQIDRITALRIKPDVNRFYFSVLWAGSPVLFLLALLQIWDGRRFGYAMWTMPLHKALGVMLACLLVVVGSQWMYWMNDATNRQLQFMLGNSFGRNFWGSVVYTFGAPYFGAGFIVLCFGWLTGYIPRNIERHRHG